MMPWSSLVMTTVAERGRPDRTVALAVWPVAACRWFARRATVARVLDVDEHGAVVGRDDDAGDLAVGRTGEEPPGGAGVRVGAHHHVAADVLPIAQAVASLVGLDPEPAEVVEPQSVRSAVVVAVDVASVADVLAAELANRVGTAQGLGRPLVAALHEQVPSERRRRDGLARLAPADDVAIVVVGTRVGGVDRRVGRCSARGAIGLVGRDRRIAATRVVGQRAVHLDLSEAHGPRPRRTPLRAVHHRGTDGVGGKPGAHADLALHLAIVGTGKVRQVAQLLLAADAVVDDRLGIGHQRQPYTRAVVPELRDVERAVVEHVAVGGSVGPVDGARADELVDVLVALVVTHVERHAVRVVHDHLRALRLEPAERGTLHRHAARIERVDLDAPAEQVLLLLVRADVPARIDRVPLVAESARSDAEPALVPGRGRSGLDRTEIAVPVFLAGEVGAPGRVAVRAVVGGAVGGVAVVQHAAVDGAVRRQVVLLRLEHVQAGRRARDPHRRVGGDAATVLRAALHLPLLAGLEGLDHRHAMRGLGLAHLLDGDAAAAGQSFHAVQLVLVGVFVVHHQQSAVVGDAEVRLRVRLTGLHQREVVHAVVVHAVLLFLLRGGLRGRHIPVPGARHDRIAPGNQHLGPVAGRHAHQVLFQQPSGCVQQVGRHALEANARKARSLRHRGCRHAAHEAAQRNAAERSQHTCADRALQESAPSYVDARQHVANRLIIGGIDCIIVARVLPALHYCSPDWGGWAHVRDGCSSHGQSRRMAQT